MPTLKKRTAGFLILLFSLFTWMSLTQTALAQSQSSCVSASIAAGTSPWWESAAFTMTNNCSQPVDLNNAKVTIDSNATKFEAMYGWPYASTEFTKNGTVATATIIANNGVTVAPGQKVNLTLGITLSGEAFQLKNLTFALANENPPPPPEKQVGNLQISLTKPDSATDLPNPKITVSGPAYPSPQTVPVTWSNTTSNPYEIKGIDTGDYIVKAENVASPSSHTTYTAPEYSATVKNQETATANVVYTAQAEEPGLVTCVSFDAKSQNYTSSIVLTNQCGKDLEMLGAKLTFSGNPGTSLWGDYPGMDYLTWKSITSGYEVIGPTGSSTWKPNTLFKDKAQMTVYYSSPEAASNIKLYITGVAPPTPEVDKGNLAISFEKPSNATDLAAPVAIVKGGDLPANGRSVTGTWENTQSNPLQVNDLTVGSYSVSADNMTSPSTGTVYMSTITPPATTVEKDKTAPVSVSYAAQAVGTLVVHVSSAPVSGISAPVVKVKNTTTQQNVATPAAEWGKDMTITNLKAGDSFSVAADPITYNGVTYNTQVAPSTAIVMEANSTKESTVTYITPKDYTVTAVVQGYPSGASQEVKLTFTAGQNKVERSVPASGGTFSLTEGTYSSVTVNSISSGGSNYTGTAAPIPLVVGEGKDNKVTASYQKVTTTTDLSYDFVVSNGNNVLSITNNSSQSIGITQLDFEQNMAVTSGWDTLAPWNATYKSSPVLASNGQPDALLMHNTVTYATAVNIPAKAEVRMSYATGTVKGPLAPVVMFPENVAVTVNGTSVTLPVKGLCTGTACNDPTPGKRIVGYYTDWDMYKRNYWPNEIPINKANTIMYAFINYDGNGKVFPYDPYSDAMQLPAIAKMRKQYPYLHASISLGGWTLSAEFTKLRVVDSGGKVTHDAVPTFSQNAVLAMRQAGFDGVDIDWEYPVVKGGPGTPDNAPQDATTFAYLLETLRSQLDAQAAADSERLGKPVKYYLSIAGPAGIDKINAIEKADPSAWGRAAKAMDYAQIMMYDFHGSFDYPYATEFQSAMRIDPISPYYANETSRSYNVVDAAANYLRIGFKPSQIIIGIPAYARSSYIGSLGDKLGLYQPIILVNGQPNPKGEWDSESDNSGMFDYRCIANNANCGTINGAQTLTKDLKKVDTSSNTDMFNQYARYSETPWAYTTTGNLLFFTYDDDISAKNKATWAKDQGFSGVMFWTYSGDLTADNSKSLINAVWQVLK